MMCHHSRLERLVEAAWPQRQRARVGQQPQDPSFGQLPAFDGGSGCNGERTPHTAVAVPVRGIDSRSPARLAEVFNGRRGIIWIPLHCKLPRTSHQWSTAGDQSSACPAGLSIYCTALLVGGRRTGGPSQEGSPRRPRGPRKSPGTEDRAPRPHPWRGRQGTDKGNSQPFRGSGKDFLDRSILGRDVAVNLVPVGVVVGQGRVNLRERKVLDFGGDLLGSQTEVVPAGNAPDRDAGTGDAGPALADFWRPLDQCSNIDNGGHFLRSILLGVGPFSDSVDGPNYSPGAFYREYVYRPGATEKRLRANQPHGCCLPVMDA